MSAFHFIFVRFQESGLKGHVSFYRFFFFTFIERQIKNLRAHLQLRKFAVFLVLTLNFIYWLNGDIIYLYSSFNLNAHI